MYLRTDGTLPSPPLKLFKTETRKSRANISVTQAVAYLLGPNGDSGLLLFDRTAGEKMSAKKTPATRTRVGKYELGKTLGEGTFAKVKFAKNLETGDSVAIKILDRVQVFRHKMVEHVTASFLLHHLLCLRVIIVCFLVECHEQHMDRWVPIVVQVTTMEVFVLSF